MVKSVLRVCRYKMLSQLLAPAHTSTSPECASFPAHTQTGTLISVQGVLSPGYSAVGRSPEVCQRSLLREPLKLSPFLLHLPLQMWNVELGHSDTNCAPLW